MPRKSAKKTLLELADDWVPEIRQAFLDAIQDVTDTVILNQVIAAIQAGDPDRAFKALGLSDAALRPITAAIERAFEAGGMAVGSTFPRPLPRTNDGVRAVFRFDVRDSRAERWLREESSRLIVEIAEGTRVGVRNMLTEGVQAGRNPRSIALDIVGRVDRQTRKRTGGIVGLTNNQERWAANVRHHLMNINHEIIAGSDLKKIQSSPYFQRELRAKGADKIILDHARRGKTLTVDQLNKLVGDYKNNTLRYRGEVIGRNEALNALRQSNRQAHQQVIDTGAAKASNVKRIWDSAGDDGRTRPDHLELEQRTRATPVGMDEPFIAADGSQMMIPGDASLGADLSQIIQCRCIEEYVIDWAADID